MMVPPPQPKGSYPLEVKDVHDGSSPQPKGSYPLEVKDVHDGSPPQPKGSYLKGVACADDRFWRAQMTRFWRAQMTAFGVRR